MQDKMEQQTQIKDTSKGVEFDGFGDKDILQKVKELLNKE